MPLELRRYDDAAAFAEAALLYLLPHEAEHCLLIGIVATAITGTHPWQEPLTFLTVESDGRPVAVALRTPPFDPALSRVLDPAAIPLLVEAFAADPGVTGVSGPAEVAGAFAGAWAERTGATSTSLLRERIYRLERVRPPAVVPGSARRATDADRDLLLDWIAAFQTDAFGRADPDQVRRTVAGRLHGEQSGFALWEDGGPVSLAGYTGPTPNGIRIAPVYTPADLRRRGYASALVAGLCQELLDEGREFCALFADLANPTANNIYQAIGFEPVADYAIYRFGV